MRSIEIELLVQEYQARVRNAQLTAAETLLGKLIQEYRLRSVPVAERTYGERKELVDLELWFREMKLTA